MKLIHTKFVFHNWLPEKRLRDANERLKKRGIPLASNQVNYSLIYRNPEENGVKAACDELGITLIAYSPIAQGRTPFLLHKPSVVFITERLVQCVDSNLSFSFTI